MLYNLLTITWVKRKVGGRVDNYGELWLGKFCRLKGLGIGNSVNQ